MAHALMAEWPRWPELLEQRVRVRDVPAEAVHDATCAREDREQQKRRRRDTFNAAYALNYGPDSVHTPHPRADALRRYCTDAVYVICEACFGLQRRTLNERHLHVQVETVVATCDVCARGRYVRPRWQEIPPPLRGLRRSEVEVLSPLSLHHGDVERHHAGYRRCTRFTRLRWKTTNFEDRLVDVDAPRRDRVREAYDYLMGSPDSAYKDFVAESFGATTSELLPFDFLTRKFLECALWPDLYPRKAWCDSRFAGAEGHASAKASFMAKVYSAVLDYVADWRLAQLTYDRWMWAQMTVRQAVGQRTMTSLSSITAGRTFGPDYIKNVRAAIVDVVRQHGFPRLYMTFAPAEWHFPLHVAIRDLMSKLGVADVFQVGGLVAMNVAAAMQNIVRGYVFGATANKPWAWRSHVLADEADPRRRTVLTFFIRSELQEGKDRESQGRHAWHWHVLGWVKTLDATRFSEEFAAHTPHDDGEVAFWVRMVQAGDRAAFPVRETATHWTVDGNVEVHYPAKDSDQYLRGYLRSLVTVPVGHMDVQVCSTRVEAIDYVAAACKYSTKRGGGLQPSFLRHHRSPFAAARTVVENYRPAEAEIWASLEGESTAHLHAQATMTTPVIAPVPEFIHVHKEFGRYLACTTRCDNTTFLEYLRAHTATGQLRQERGGRNSIRAATVLFANCFNPDYFWQLFYVHTPMRTRTGRIPQEVERVPDGLRGFAAVFAVQPGLHPPRVDLRTDASTAAFFETECFGRSRVRDMVAHVAGLRALRERCLSGQLYEQLIVAPGGALPDLTSIQLGWLRHVQGQLLAQAARYEEGYEGPETMDVVCLHGAPGTGKSTCLRHLLAWVAAENLGDAALFCPTGVLADSFRMAGVQAVVDTFDGGTGYGQVEVLQAAARIAAFCVLIVDEVFSLTEEQFTFVNEAHAANGHWGILVFAGDPQQGRPFNASGEGRVCTDSHLWRFVRCTELLQPHRCDRRTFDFLNEIRFAKPTPSWLTGLSEHCHVHEGPVTKTLVADLLEDSPETTFLAVSRGAVHALNNLVSEVIFERETSLGRFVLQEGSEAVPLFRGERLVITTNLDKGAGLVNGKVCTLLAADGAGLHVRVNGTGRLCCVTRRTLDDIVVFPLIRGHALTIAKAQGSTLAHVTLYCEEHVAVPGVGYVALTRVRRLTDIRIIGYPCTDFFRPHRCIL